MSEPDVQLRLPALPENVALVRQAMSGIADALEVDPALLADIKTAVTEACNNVVLHAYPERGDGRMEIDANPVNGAMTITVRDYGAGMQPHPDESSSSVPTAGFGLPLIAALSDKFEIHGGSGLGIEVRMVFLLIEGAALPDAADGAEAGSPPDPPTQDSKQAAGVAILPGPMMAPVLGRMVAMLAARSDFSLDRLSDAVLVTDAVSANLGDYISGRYASITFQDGKHKIDLRLGPLVEGGGERLVRAMELPGLDRSLKELADEVKVEDPRKGAEASNGEYLLIRLVGDG